MKARLSLVILCICFTFILINILFLANSYHTIKITYPQKFRVEKTFPSATTTQFFLYYEEERMTNFDFIQNLEESEQFREFFTQTLTSVEYNGAFFETKPMKNSQIHSELEFVLVESTEVSNIQADPNPFDYHFYLCGNTEVRAFQNLGGDATLIAPCPNERNYGHLLQFLREGPEEQISELWRMVGYELNIRLSSNSPVWLSTSGLGVSWLHVRICDSPKYYSFSEYKKFIE